MNIQSTFSKADISASCSSAPANVPTLDPDSAVRIVRERRHLYEFDSEGRGCKFWTDHQIELIRDAGLLVDEGQVAEARDAILRQYPDEVRYPLVVGSHHA